MLIQYSSDLRFLEWRFSCIWNLFFSGPSQSSAEIMHIFPQIFASHFSVLPAFGKQNPISMWNLYLGFACIYAPSAQRDLEGYVSPRQTCARTGTTLKAAPCTDKFLPPTIKKSLTFWKHGHIVYHLPDYHSFLGYALSKWLLTFWRNTLLQPSLIST
jgi:hypothetical protein